MASPSALVAAEWWRAFGSSELDALVAEAFVNNADLEAARATLRQSRALSAAGRGGFWPTLGLGLNSARQKAEPIPANGAGGAFPPYTLHTGRVEVSYAPNLFGGTRREVEGLVAEEDRQRFELDAAALTVDGNLASAAI
ncbi:TolC family protein [Teichococcus aestuarii]|uniref:RND transporter n=1 Tax=Teichococcus aestuarii TaxID=568898 RepID=A0A2U1UXE6_9PROT|nr:TolC family protein [Pseudoroseomonas aestuarii]PWC26344.1 hypothetical protein CR165_23725 [Pseudoroseomonas aestuarii]